MIISLWRKALIGFVVVALGSFLLLGLLLVLEYRSWCCGPELPMYPGATHVQSTQATIFDAPTSDMRHVTYRTTASVQEVVAYYKAEGEKRGYPCYRDLTRLQTAGLSLVGRSDYSTEGGDIVVTWREGAGATFVDVRMLPFRSISPHYCD
jgi:hypothetical protein